MRCCNYKPSETYPQRLFELKKVKVREDEIYGAREVLTDIREILVRRTSSSGSRVEAISEALIKDLEGGSSWLHVACLWRASNFALLCSMSVGPKLLI